MEWICTHEVQAVKHLLGDHTTTEEGMAILREWKKFMLHQGAQSGGHEWMPWGCCTSGSTVNTVPAARPVLVAWHGNADTESDQWL